jgi:hypothetical protein
MKRFRDQILATGMVLPFVSSCGSFSSKRGPEVAVLDWDDLTSTRHHNDLSQPKSVAAVKSNEASPAVTTPPLSGPNFGPVLNSLVSGFQMENPSLYEGGVYGKKGHVPVFAASLANIPNYDRLYWVMVKVLSEKYGCFIKRKQSTATQVAVECRDTRRVVFHRNRGDGWIQFYGRQYDKHGRELAVRSHQAYVVE